MQEQWSWEIAKKAQAATGLGNCVLVYARDGYSIQYSKEQAKTLSLNDLAKIAESQMAKMQEA